MASSEQRFRLAFEDNMSPMIFTDLQDRVIEANAAFCTLIGRTKEQILGVDSKPFTLPADIGITEEVHQRISSGEASQVKYVKRYLHSDGRIIVVEVAKSPARDAAGRTLHYVISERDITELTQRNHMQDLRTAINKLTEHATSEERFLQRLAKVMNRVGGYALAFIGTPSSDEVDIVDIVCAEGVTEYLFEGTQCWWELNASGRGPAEAALENRVSQITNDLADGGLFEFWRARAVQFGFESHLAIPVTLEGRLGVLSLFDRHARTFNERIAKELESIVNDAVIAVAHERSLDQTEAALAESVAANRALHETEQRFRLAFENNMAPMIFTDLENHVIAANDAFCNLIGYDRTEILGRGTSHFTHPEDVNVVVDPQRRLVSGAVDRVSFVKRYLSKDGRVIVISALKSAARGLDGEILYFVSSQRDITEERALNEQLSHQALHDPLTGLANRALFDDRLLQANARIVRQGGFGAVLLLDLDDFKGVNDTYGHLVGDQLLVGVARRLELVTCSSDTLCRFGGDEFLYLAEGLTSAAEVEEVANRLLDILSEPFTFNGIVLEQHASMGVVICDGSIQDHNDCVQEADVALYEAKRLRRGRHLIFNPNMQQQAISRFSLIQELRLALQSGDLAMHYQPIINLTTFDIVGFEALMRWQHPERGWIPPDVFIPLAEQSDLILELGSFAMREAVTAANEWGQTIADTVAPYVTVNLSAHQFHDPVLISMVEGALSSSGLSPECLIIEITESVALLDATETMNMISHLNRLGIGIALDDFGTGYSSLSYLALLMPRIIKIDRSFVSPDHESNHNRTLLEAIVSLGHKLDTTVLAEGIETPAQLERLRLLGCQLGQGYLFSHAVPHNEVAIMLDGGSPSWLPQALRFHR